MRLGINYVPPHSSPEEWAEVLAKKGYRAAAFPVNFRAPVHQIDAYAEAAKARDIRIAEVGVWKSPHHPDRKTAEEARTACLEQFRLADYIRADCCVNVSGAAGPEWYYCYRENYAGELYGKNVEWIRYLCDAVKPEHTSYALEPMPWMLPWSVEQYVRFFRDVGREHFKVHMDIWNLINSPYLYTHQRELMDQAFGTLGPEIVSCHIKDIRMELRVSAAILEVPVGEGEADLVYYLEKISRLDPEMPVLIEHQKGMGAFDQAFRKLKLLESKIETERPRVWPRNRSGEAGAGGERIAEKAGGKNGE